MSLIVPVLLIFVLVICLFKRQKVYDIFVQGSSEAIPLLITILPYVVAVLLMSELFEISGLSSLFIKILTRFHKYQAHKLTYV